MSKLINEFNKACLKKRKEIEDRNVTNDWMKSSVKNFGETKKRKTKKK